MQELNLFQRQSTRTQQLLGWHWQLGRPYGAWIAENYISQTPHHRKRSAFLWTDRDLHGT